MERRYIFQAHLADCQVIDSNNDCHIGYISDHETNPFLVVVNSEYHSHSGDIIAEFSSWVNHQQGDNNE